MADNDLLSARAALRSRLTPFGLWFAGPKLATDPAEPADLAADRRCGALCLR